MGQQSEDFDINLSCDCGFEQVVRVVTPHAGPVRRTCPECGSAQLHARGLFPESRDFIEQIDDLMRNAIESFRPLGVHMPSATNPPKSGPPDRPKPADKRP